MCMNEMIWVKYLNTGSIAIKVNTDIYNPLDLCPNVISAEYHNFRMVILTSSMIITLVILCKVELSITALYILVKIYIIVT